MRARTRRLGAGLARLLLAGLALTAVRPAQAADATRDPTAGGVAEAVLALFNAGEPAAYETYLRVHGPTLAASDDYLDTRAQTGGYDVVAVSETTPSRRTELVKARFSDDFYVFRVELGSGPASPITALSFTPVDRPMSVPGPDKVPPAAIGRVIDRELATIGDFSGVALVAEDGRRVYARAEGLADRTTGLRNTVDTRFRMASMGKMFTATAIMQLNQAGRLDLDSPVGAYLKDYPNAAFARAVTVRQLLTHTGGAGDFMSQTWADNYERLKTPADYIALFGNRAPEFIPGSRFGYANYGYVVLGRIIEVVSGQAYEAYLKAHVFRPAGMTRSGLNAPPMTPARLATPYVRTAKGFQAAPAPFSGPATPAGGAYSTVGDLLAFANALMGHRLLDRAHTDMLLSPKVRGDSGPYAFGFEVRDADGRRDVGHDGGGPGQNGGFRILDGGRAVVVVLSNVAPTWRADKLCAFVAARLRLERTPR